MTAGTGPSSGSTGNESGSSSASVLPGWRGWLGAVLVIAGLHGLSGGGPDRHKGAEQDEFVPGREKGRSMASAAASPRAYHLQINLRSRANHAEDRHLGSGVRSVRHQTLLGRRPAKARDGFTRHEQRVCERTEHDDASRYGLQPNPSACAVRPRRRARSGYGDETQASFNPLVRRSP